MVPLLDVWRQRMAIGIASGWSGIGYRSRVSGLVPYANNLRTTAVAGMIGGESSPSAGTCRMAQEASLWQRGFTCGEVAAVSSFWRLVSPFRVPAQGRQETAIGRGRPETDTSCHQGGAGSDPESSHPGLTALRGTPDGHFYTRTWR